MIIVGDLYMSSNENIKVMSDEYFTFVIEILKQGQIARLNVVGTSMNPFISTHKDSVDLIAAGFSDIHRSDIVLYQRRNGQYVLHRVFKKTDNQFYMLGDAQSFIEGPLYPNQVIAKAIAINKKKASFLNKSNSTIACDSLRWRVVSQIWLLLRPFRRGIMKSYLFLMRRPKK